MQMTQIGVKFMYVAGVMVCGAGTVIFGSVYMLCQNKNSMHTLNHLPEAPVQHLAKNSVRIVIKCRVTRTSFEQVIGLNFEYWR